MGTKGNDSEDEEYDEEDLPIEQRASYKWVQRSIENDGSCG